MEPDDPFARGDAPVFGGPGGAGLALLFAPGQRPTAADLAASELPLSPDRIEIVASGLRFALAGLGPQPAASAPAIDQVYGFAAAPDLSSAEAVLVRPAERVGRGDGLVPVVRTLVELGQSLARLPGLVALCWVPARTAMAPDHFRRITAAWLDGGAFPGLGLTALTVTSEGARSSGLALFTGYEIATSGTASPADDAKLALRAIHVLADRGASGYDALDRITAGELQCEFTANRRILLIRQVPRGSGRTR